MGETLLKNYSLGVSNKICDPPKDLTWNVFYKPSNSKDICVFNVFEHGGFYQSLLKLKKENDFTNFSEEVKRNLMYYFWAKSEWETVITSWPPHITREEVERIKNKVILVDIEKEQEERKTLSQEELHKKIAEEYCSDNEYVRYFGYVILEVASKVDIYDQIMLNWDKFIEYLWNNKNLIKKAKVQ